MTFLAAAETSSRLSIDSVPLTAWSVFYIAVEGEEQVRAADGEQDEEERGHKLFRHHNEDADPEDNAVSACARSTAGLGPRQGPQHPAEHSGSLRHHEPSRTDTEKPARPGR